MSWLAEGIRGVCVAAFNLLMRKIYPSGREISGTNTTLCKSSPLLPASSTCCP